MSNTPFMHKLTARFLGRLLATPEGKAHLLNQVADAEATDEGAIFDRLLEHVDDPKLRQMISRHHADELRHAELFRACLARTGVDPGPVPAHLQILPRIDQHAGGIMDKPIENERDIMEAYLLLLVIEERALEQFAQFIPAFESVGDHETAETFRSVQKDEERHLRYCHAISRRYAPGDATWDATLTVLRRAEAKAFSQNSSANMAYAFEHGLYPASTLERQLWSGMLWLGRRVAVPTRAARQAAHYGNTAALGTS